MKITLLIMASMVSSLTLAAEYKTPPPVDLMLLPFKKVHEGDPKKGHHGEKSYCYRMKDVYTIYSENLLGDGYSFLKEAPADQACIVSKGMINTSNNLGLTVGIAKKQLAAC